MGVTVSASLQETRQGKTFHEGSRSDRSGRDDEMSGVAANSWRAGAEVRDLGGTCDSDEIIKCRLFDTKNPRRYEDTVTSKTTGTVSSSSWVGQHAVHNGGHGQPRGRLHSRYSQTEGDAN